MSIEIETADERGMLMSIEKLFGKVAMAAQQSGAPDEIIEKAMLNMLCFAMCAHYVTNDQAIANITQALPHAMADARRLYDAAQARRGG